MNSSDASNIFSQLRQLSSQLDQFTIALANIQDAVCLSADEEEWQDDMAAGSGSDTDPIENEWPSDRYTSASRIVPSLAAKRPKLTE